MVNVFINRIDKSDVQVLGILIAYRKFSKIMELKTLELPDKNNEVKVSCIPSGTYQVKMTDSPKHGMKLYEVMNVPGRSGIRFDKANYFSELLGCIAVGFEFVD